MNLFCLHGVRENQGKITLLLGLCFFDKRRIHLGIFMRLA